MLISSKYGSYICRNEHGNEYGARVQNMLCGNSYCVLNFLSVDLCAICLINAGLAHLNVRTWSCSSYVIFI